MARFRVTTALAVVVAIGAVPAAQVDVTAGPKGVVVNSRTGKAYAAFPDLGVVKIVKGKTGAVAVLQTGANVKNLTIDPRNGLVYAMNRGPGTISVTDPDSAAAAGCDRYQDQHDLRRQYAREQRVGHRRPDEHDRRYRAG
jgi:DNA-binding beta-propeller fold protein YncE